MSEQNLRIYPNREKSFESELKTLAESNICQRNKELIAKFQNYLFSTGSKGLRVAKLTSQLRLICNRINKPLDILTKTDLIDLLALFSQNKFKEDKIYSEATKADYRRVIKQFYKWFKDEDQKLESKDENIKIQAKNFSRKRSWIWRKSWKKLRLQLLRL